LLAMASRSFARRLVLAMALLLGSATAADIVASMEISGIVKQGLNKLNGRYRRSTTLRENNYPCYKHADRAIYICRDEHSYWVAQPRQHAGTINTYMYAAEPEAPSPWMAGNWKTYNEVTKRWEVDEKIVAVRAEEPEEPLVKRSIAILMFGSLIALAIILMFARSMDVHLRQQTYWLLADTISFTMACLISGAVDLIFYDAVLPKMTGKPPQEDDEVAPGIYLAIPFVVFTCVYLFLTFAGWKVQFSKRRLEVMFSLGSHAVAIFGVFAFALVHRFVLDELSPELRSVTGEPETGPARLADIYSGALMFAVSFLLLYMYAWATFGIRAERFSEAPNWPWAKKEIVQRVRAVKEAERTCCGTRTVEKMMPVQEEVHGMDWREVVDNGEVNATSIILGYVLTAILLRDIAGKPLKFMLDWEEMDSDVLQKWLVVVLVLFVLAGFALYGLSTSKKMSWSLEVIRRTAVMSAAWALFAALRWEFLMWFEDSPPLSQASFTFAMGVASFLMLYIIDKVLDRLRANGKAEHTETALRVLTCALGLIIGYALFMTFWEASETVITRGPLRESFEDPDSQHIVIGLGMLLIAAMLMFPYMRGVIPGALIDEESYRKMIDAERKEMEEHSLW